MQPSQQGDGGDDAQNGNGKHGSRANGDVRRSPERIPQNQLKREGNGQAAQQKPRPGHGPVSPRGLKAQLLGGGFSDLELHGRPNRWHSPPILLCRDAVRDLGLISLVTPPAGARTMPHAAASTSFPAIRRDRPQTLQVNLGYRCNQACRHCHVGAGPWRDEWMDGATVSLIPKVLAACGLRVLDLTGGAPELHPQFRFLVRQARGLGVEVIDRCNLTILQEHGQEDLADFLAAHGVTVVASLPCYEAETVDRQRGTGVFARSVEGLKQLNGLGYGQEGTGLHLHLAYNPQGPTLPPAQRPLEAAFKDALAREHGVVFNELKVITNMPIQRFAEQLRRDGTWESYMELLRANHALENVDRVMCRTLISVDWQGKLYDCDFNQMLGIPAPLGGHLRDLLDHCPPLGPIEVGDHCYGCTAGHGSSCGGALQQGEPGG